MVCVCMCECMFMREIQLWLSPAANDEHSPVTIRRLKATDCYFISTVTGNLLLPFLDYRKDFSLSHTRVHFFTFRYKHMYA